MPFDIKIGSRFGIFDNFQKWPKSQKWPKWSKIGKIAKNRPNWPKIVQMGQKSPQIGQIAGFRAVLKKIPRAEQLRANHTTRSKWISILNVRKVPEACRVAFGSANGPPLTIWPILAIFGQFWLFWPFLACHVLSLFLSSFSLFCDLLSCFFILVASRRKMGDPWRFWQGVENGLKSADSKGGRAWSLAWKIPWN